MVLALEVACATGRSDDIKTCAHKVYQSMVPLLKPSLHRGSSLFHPLTLLYEALLSLEGTWDEGTARVFACTSYDLIRMGTELEENDVKTNVVAEIYPITTRTLEFQASIKEKLLTHLSSEQVNPDDLLMWKMSTDPKEAMKVWKALDASTTTVDRIQAQCTMCRVALSSKDDELKKEAVEWLSNVVVESDLLALPFLNYLHTTRPHLFPILGNKAGEEAVISP